MSRQKQKTRLRQAIDETLEYMEINYDEEQTEDDALEYIMGNCGKQEDGSCLNAGSEDCDFECPFSGE